MCQKKDRLTDLTERCRGTINLSANHYACILMTLNSHDVRFVEVEAVLALCGYTERSFLAAWADGQFDA